MSETDVIAAPRPLLLADGRPADRAWTLDPAMRHLNHGSFGAVPLVAQERQKQLRVEMECSPVVWFPALPQRIADTRVEIADFLAVAADDLALVPNASAGISTVYAALDRRRSGEIVVTDHGYGAVTMGAERLARDRWDGGVRTARVPLDADEEQACEAVFAELSEATDLIVVDQITSATARRLPVCLSGSPTPGSRSPTSWRWPPTTWPWCRTRARASAPCTPPSTAAAAGRSSSPTTVTAP
ncbi:selenocysteine lyase / isopenicillin Nepimerase [Streptomyces iranensis]|uniref:Selenocysteine lyase / isopenicillin Nepimerase n=1 Tax=Streptomyces iranensis TaxID=576784 RepID=A0A061A413_9ACTN|nr:selenocysteine lyase / isopenicillin Nepimerase [Streptomyces iranensis]